MTKLSSKFSRMRPTAPASLPLKCMDEFLKSYAKLLDYSTALEKYADFLENEIIEGEKSE